jgi:predicted transcriptional regulator
VSFDNQRDFEKFVRNISILISIQQLKPTSINELAKLLEKDHSTLNKLIIFFEKEGVVKIKEGKVNGRAVKTPRVDYDRIEFKLAAV